MISFSSIYISIYMSIYISLFILINYRHLLRTLGVLFYIAIKFITSLKGERFVRVKILLVFATDLLLGHDIIGCFKKHSS